MMMNPAASVAGFLFIYSYPFDIWIFCHNFVSRNSHR